MSSLQLAIGQRPLTLDDRTQTTKNPSETALASVVILDEAQVPKTEYQLYLRDMLQPRDDGTTLAQKKGIAVVVVCGPNSKSLMQWCQGKGFEKVVYGNEEITGRMRHQVIARSLISKGMKKHERCRAMASNFVHAVQEWPDFRTFVFFVNGPSMFGELRKAIFYSLCRHWRWIGGQAEPPVKYTEEELLDRFFIEISWLLNGGVHSDLDWPESELLRPLLLGMLTPKAEVSWNNSRIQVGLYEGFVWAFNAAHVLVLGRASHDQENQQKSRNARVCPGINIIHTCEPPRKELLCCAMEPDLLLNLIEDDPARVSFLHETPTPLLMGPAVTSSMEWGLLRYGPKTISLEDPSGLPFVLTPLGEVVRKSKGRDFSANLLICTVTRGATYCSRHG